MMSLTGLTAMDSEKSNCAIYKNTIASGNPHVLVCNALSMEAYTVVQIRKFSLRSGLVKFSNP
jgi:hypothetical protein